MSEKVGFGIVSILHLVGFIGIGLAVAPEMIWLTPLNLLISLAVALYFDQNNNSSLFQFAVLSFLIGYGIEVVGIQTGKIFGSYQYGDILGPKLWDTPLMIGINWVLLCYCAGYSINALAPKLNNILKAAIAASMLVILDFIIEPIAIQWDMWTWSAKDIPLQNYIAWWIIGFIMMNLFYYFLEKRANKVAVAVFIIQFLFFGLLNL